MQKSKKYYKIINLQTKEEINEKQIPQANHIANLPLEITYDYRALRKYFTKSSLKKNTLAVLKYKKLFPLRDTQKLISLKEGNSPLYKSNKLDKKLGFNLYFKHEGFNPTGAFKDRGSLIEISKAREYQARAVVVASTGNMAASVSAYCSYADIPCFVFVPESIPNAKLAQILFYGGKLIKIKGNYDEATVLAEQTASKFNFYLAGDYAFRLEGQKSLAYEIVEQLGFKPPSYVFVPVGNGTNISAIWKGFQEYQKLGIIERLPRMVAVQVDSYNSVYYAYKNNLAEIKPIIRSKKTVASAVAVKKPIDGDKVMHLLRESNGIAITVSDKETLQAQVELASLEALFTEPSSATVFAALKKLRQNGNIKVDNHVVCVLTGIGLKDPISALYLLPKHIVIEPDFSAVVDTFSRNKWIV